MTDVDKKIPTKPKAAVGRPTDYNESIAALICEKVATSTLGLARLCKMHPELPDRDTINLWRFKHKEFSAQYLDAKRSQMDLVIESLDEILDENIKYYTDDKGFDRIDSPSVTIAVAKANNRKWHASKLAPKIYGAHIEESKGVSDSLVEKLIDRLVE